MKNILLILLLTLLNYGIAQHKTLEYYKKINIAYEAFEKEDYTTGIFQLEMIHATDTLKQDDLKGLIYGYSENYEFEAAFDLIQTLKPNKTYFNKKLYESNYPAIKEVAGWDEFIFKSLDNKENTAPTELDTFNKRKKEIQQFYTDSVTYFYYGTSHHEEYFAKYDKRITQLLKDLKDWTNTKTIKELNDVNFFNDFWTFRRNTNITSDSSYYRSIAPLFEKALKLGYLSPFKFMQTFKNNDSIFNLGFNGILVNENKISYQLTEKQKLNRAKYGIGNYRYNYLTGNYYKINF